MLYVYSGIYSRSSGFLLFFGDCFLRESRFRIVEGKVSYGR